MLPVLTVEVVIVVLVVLTVPLLSIALRRRVLSRGGSIELSLRLREKSHGRGWVLGVGTFVGDEPGVRRAEARLRAVGQPV